MGSKRLIVLVLTALCPVPGLAKGGLRLYPEGRRFRAWLDILDVENRWLAKGHVNWRTGRPDGKPARLGPRTHCSAFVAAACLRLGIPMLKPPPQMYLSNRQQDWLRTGGRRLGWRSVGAVRAQELANRGYLVVASWKNREKDRYHRGAGHIAVVRPQIKSVALIRKRGPQITQAGRRNYQTSSVAVGFRGRAWDKGEVRYFAYLRGRALARR
jgi:hypothetical protein